MPDARGIAREVLAAAGEGEKLDAYMSRVVYASGIRRRDQVYVVALVKKVLRNRNLLDYQITVHAKRPASDVQPPLLNILRVAAAELLLMRTPDYAAVNEAVETARGAFGKKAAAFVNAVLRRVAEQDEPALPDASGEVRYLSVKYSHPDWLVKRWLERFGKRECEEILATNNTEAPIFVVHNPLLTSREELTRSFTEEGARTKPGPLGTLRVELQELPVASVAPLTDGRALIVDPSSTLGVRALAARPGAAVLDMCAGVGGKTWQLSWAAGRDGRVIAADRVHGKIRKLAANIPRFSEENVRPVVADLTKDLVSGLKYILLDVPCSNTGVLRRKPDVRWRLKETDFPGYAALQLALASAGARALVPGGTLVYQTCSTEPEENERVVEAVLSALPEIKLQAPKDPELAPYLDGKYLRSWPHRDGTNGAFVAVMRKG